MCSETKSFDIALRFVLNWETVFSKGHWGDFAFAIAENDPDDPGGVTKFGLDARSHGDKVADLTLSQASEIYRKEYWERYKCDKLPFPVSLFLFDSAVNVGFRQTTLWFQRLARASADGVWGPKTDQAVMDWINDEGPTECFKQLCEARREFYKALKKPKFESGWLNRVTALKRFATDAEDA